MRALAGLAAVLLALPGAVPAAALTPPQVDPQVAPPPGSAGPPAPMVQRSACVTSSVLPGTDPAAAVPPLDLAAAWRYGRGEGQTVAVIDTGVQPGPRLPDVQAGGDFVAASDGLTDCDGHGTLVAGLIAGRPGGDSFAGVAPAAGIIAIRQNSVRFSPQNPGADPELTRVQRDVEALARAVVRAADLGARVINISVVTCMPADATVSQAELGAALRYAAVDKDAVIVAAAGNIGGGTAGSACMANPLADPARPDDPRNWAGATSVSIPSWWQPYVLSVGSLTPTGGPSEFTMTGPWVGIAAPGERITSISNGPDGGLADALPGGRGELVPVSGTSYAAAYVSGVAALVRGRFPELTAGQVIERLTATAQGAARDPSNLTGAGAVDPVAALTWMLPGPATEFLTTTDEPRALAAPPPPEPRDNRPVVIAFTGVGVLTLIAAGAWVLAAQRRKDHTVQDQPQ